jgi:hypothetical protein
MLITSFATFILEKYRLDNPICADEKDCIENYLERQSMLLDDLITNLLTQIATNKKLKKAGQAVKKLQQPWEVVPYQQMQNLFSSYQKLGFVKNEKSLNEICQLFINNILLLEINTRLSGHTPYGVETLLHEIGYCFKGSKEKYDFKELPFTEEQFQEYTDEYFYDVNQDQYRISDYGLKPLLKLSKALMLAKTDNEKIPLLTMILDVVHPRSDLAALFIEGGSNACKKLSTV